MGFDFTTRVDRRGSGAAKWEDMFRKKPNVSPEVIPLSVADMELPNPPEIIQGLKDHLDKAVLGYTTPTPEYTQAVIDWMKKRHNWNIKAEWIVLSPGVVPAFFTAIRAFTEPGGGGGGEISSRRFITPFSWLSGTMTGFWFPIPLSGMMPH
ncbi:MAG: hypothetical protein LBK63_03025 [Treponema sp.]|jgi:aminotransferase/cystathionine beta-lyase|nr:hypothetical protein [Treponema sp.]